MKQSRFTLNIIGDAPNFDYNAALTFVTKLNPRWLVVINNLQFCRDVLARLPQCNIIVRWVENDNSPIQSWHTPENFIAFVRREFGGLPLWANVANEAGFSDEQLKWCCDVIDKAPDLRFAVGGWSVGTPEPQDLFRPQCIELLKRCGKHRDRVVLNIHEYFPALPHMWIEGADEKNPAQSAWPKSIVGKKCHLMGRWQNLLAPCQQHGITGLRIVICETGADDISQLKTWLASLLQTPGYLNIRGWQTLRVQDEAWYGKHYELAFWDKLIYCDTTIYYADYIEGLALFAWCSPTSEWARKGFDVSQALIVQTKMIEHAQEVTPVPETRPPVPKPGHYTIEASKGLNCRANAGESETILVTLKTGQRVTVLPFTPNGYKPVGNYDWVNVEAYVTQADGSERRFVGWCAIVDGHKWNPIIAPPQEPDFEAVFADVRALVSQQRQAALQSVNAQFDALEANITKIESKYLANSQEENAA